jgi:hypothetical protein
MSIPAGTYRALAVTGSDLYGHTQSGDEKMSVELELLDIGERVTVYLYFSEKAKPYAVEKLKAMGWDGSDSMESVGSKECTVRVKYEDYQGKQQMKADVVTGGAGMGEQMKPSAKSAFLAKLAGKQQDKSGLPF